MSDNGQNAAPIQPSPQPTQIEVGGSGGMVYFRFVTAQGQSIFFLPPEMIGTVVEGLTRAKSAATSGLVIPPGGIQAP